jgi:hypothetical protein
LLQSDKNFENQRNEVLNDEKEDDNGEAGKKKRRRRRRRKKKNKDGEPDSQKEGKPDEMEGKSDQEKVELHFEDVEEIPSFTVLGFSLLMPTVLILSVFKLIIVGYLSTLSKFSLLATGRWFSSNNNESVFMEFVVNQSKNLTIHKNKVVSFTKNGNRTDVLQYNIVSLHRLVRDIVL